jgi:hypothetical protein
MKQYPTYFEAETTRFNFRVSHCLTLIILSFSFIINLFATSTIFVSDATLNHLMSLNHYKEKNTRGMSVLHEVPTNRTCENAAILPH